MCQEGQRSFSGFRCLVFRRHWLVVWKVLRVEGPHELAEHIGLAHRPEAPVACHVEGGVRDQVEQKASTRRGAVILERLAVAVAELPPEDYFRVEAAVASRSTRAGRHTRDYGKVQPGT